MSSRTAIAASIFLFAVTVQQAYAANPPADPCSLLPPAFVSKTLSGSYPAPDKTVAPRPFANTNEGTDCIYHGQHQLMFRIYFDPSPAAATDLFSRLGKFYSPQTPAPGIGDEAYFDKQHALHVRKGNVRFFLDIGVKTPAGEAMLKDLAAKVLAQL